MELNNELLDSTPYPLSSSFTSDNFPFDAFNVTASTTEVPDTLWHESPLCLNGTSESCQAGAQRLDVHFLLNCEVPQPHKKSSTHFKRKYNCPANLVNGKKGTSKPSRRRKRSTGHKKVKGKDSSSGSSLLKGGIQKVSSVAKTHKKGSAKNKLARATARKSQNNLNSEVEENITHIEHGIGQLHIDAPPKGKAVNCSAGRSGHKKHRRKKSKSSTSCYALPGRLCLPMQHTHKTVSKGHAENLGKRYKAPKQAESRKYCDIYLWCGYCILGDNCPYADTHHAAGSQVSTLVESSLLPYSAAGEPARVRLLVEYMVMVSRPLELLIDGYHLQFACLNTEKSVESYNRGSAGRSCSSLLKGS
ncbi:unnamed protein product [Enterobius vermicularis]|uniref:C3H1-type domain-containing protein n=1 Tax=Enterobius vermicularis TaxID=51028 RepID=A0A158QB90_ENTVE|nr:unnamed protein product [Enterobius vermicularis]